VNSWLLQANPDQFDVTNYVEQFRDIYWSIKKEAWRKKVAVGDEIFIWRAMGSARVDSGVVASGYVTEPATPKERVRFPVNMGENLWQAGYSELSLVKIGIHLTSVRTTPTQGMLLKSHFIADPVLSRAQIVTVRAGAVFLLPQVQAQRIRNLWEGENEQIIIETLTGLEGAIVERIHRFRERDRVLVLVAKRLFIDNHKSLFCTICGFSFPKTYGELGNDFIEAHHTKPISKRVGEEETQANELVMVCANCHRMIHKTSDFEGNYHRLVEMFGSR
jgi:hypothetical protein